MSLLDLGPDTITLFADDDATTDGYGNELATPNESGTEVRGRWQPSSSEERDDLGQQTSTVYRFLTRDFPAGPWAIATFDDATWEVIGEPRRHRGSALTSHVTVYFKLRA